LGGIVVISFFFSTNLCKVNPKMCLAACHLNVCHVGSPSPHESSLPAV
jgi:hypothetical protein